MQTQELRRLCRDILQRCSKELFMETGVVSRIVNDRYEIIAVISQNQVFVEGESYNFHNTICSQMFDCGATIAIADSSSLPKTTPHPLYLPRTMKAYIGTPIIVGGTIWGALDFTSFAPRPTPFSEDNIRCIEECAAQLVDSLLAAQPV